MTPTRKGSQLDMVLNKQGRPVGELNVGDSLGCKDYDMGGVQDHERRKKTNSRTVSMDFQREGFGLLRDLLGMGYGPGERRDPGELVESQESRSPS